MAAAPRIRIEANADVSHCLSQIRQAYHLHAQQQLAPGRIPDLWTTLHRTHYTHGWRMHASQSGQPGWKPPTLGTEDDPRDFVPFLRRQLAPDELAFALFVVFQGHRTSMRDDAGAEVKRRYNALRGNVGNFSEDDIMFELGPEVLRSTPALRTLNSLLNPRETAALRFHPVAVFRAVRAEMLERHHDAVNPPSVLPIDVNRAALRLRPRAASASASATPTPAPQVGVALAAAQYHAQQQAQQQGPEEEGGGEEEQQEDGFRAPSVPSHDGSLFPPTSHKRKSAGGPASPIAPRRRRLNQAVEGDEEDEESVPPPKAQQRHQEQQQQQKQQQEEEDEDPDSGRRESTPGCDCSFLDDAPFPPSRPQSPSIPSFSPLLDTPRTPIRAEPLPSGAVSSPADFRTPPQGPLVLPAEARPVVREELERWREIVRLVQAMPEPTGNSLWVETVRAATQSMRPVSLWVENMLDEDALRDDTAQ
ncbi:uncharacterized protein CTRU02_215140 [Colletotrichum truncatum]|uniref:Uncharacterized protein n=1 Tax=Colletotrichum truncatum TaxID=5467 RepID=A0ACC3YDJ5_COLTU